jgi:gliding motility-associated-like protein
MRTLTNITLCVLFSATAMAQSFYNVGSHVYISAGTTFSVSDSLVNKSILTNQGNMVIGGVWLNQGTYNPGNGEITFNSPANADVQIINHNSQSFSKLTISGGGEKVILADMTIEGEFVLADGVITQENDARIVFAPGAVISGGSDASHINGTVVQQGTGDKLFPIGDGTTYMPVNIQSIASNSEVAVTMIEPSGGVDLSKSQELKEISDVRYWQIDVASGSLEGAQLVLPLINESAAITSAENIVIAEADALEEPFRAIASSSYDAETSTVTSAAPAASLVALGSLADNPLIVVYNAVSPNGDNLNERLIIGNITQFPGNTVTIFNRWGDKVFEMKGYDNDQRIFRGVSNVSGNKELTPGTYFYLIDKGDGSEKINGFISIKK